MPRLLRIILAVIVIAAAGPLSADTITINEKLSDDAFYRAIACGAKPTQTVCHENKRYWYISPNRPITVSIRIVQDGYPSATEKAFRKSLAQVVGDINAVGSRISMKMVPGDQYANISIYLVTAKEGETVSNLPGLRGGEIGVYHMRYWYRGRKIKEADMVVGDDLSANAAYPYIMEQFLFALGLRYDIDGPAYQGKSIFHLRGTRTMSEQDKRIFRMHYPPKI